MSGGDLQVRSATEDDFELIWQMYRDAVRPFVEPRLGRSWDDGEERDRFRHIWRPSESYVVTVGEDVIGWYAAMVTERRAAIHHFAIAEPHRRHGHATKLLSDLIHGWRSQGKDVEASALKESSLDALHRQLGGHKTREEELAVVVEWKRL